MTWNALLLTSVLLSSPSQPDPLAKRVDALLTTVAKAPVNQEQANAVKQLIQLGKAAVPHLAKAVTHDQPALRYHAVAVLGAIGSDAAPAIPKLIQAATSPMQAKGVRQRAVYSLGEIRADAKRCVPFLLKTLQQADPDLDTLAGEALVKFGPKAKPAVPALVKMVQGRKGKLTVVVTILGQFGRHAKAAVPALQGLRADPMFVKIRPLVTQALEQIQGAKSKCR